MNFKLELIWNHTKVCEAKTTATIAHEIIRNFMLGNFNDCSTAPNLHQILSLRDNEKSTGLYGEYENETGIAEFRLEFVK